MYLRLAVILQKLSFLVWIDANGEGIGLLIRLAMIIIGAIMVYLVRSDFSGREPID